MATAQITTPIASQPGNFHFDVSIVSNNGLIDRSSFTKNNLQITDSGNNVSASNINILQGEGNDFQIRVSLPVESSGVISITVVGSVSVIASDGTSSSETITETSASINYDTRGGILLTFGRLTYNEDNSITIPVTVEEAVTSLSRTDFIFEEIEGDNIDCMLVSLSGQGSQYVLTMLPEIDRAGRFIVDVRGYVFTVTGVLLEEIVSAHAIVPYNTLIPRIVHDTSPDFFRSGDLFLEFNVPVLGMAASSIDTTGLRLGTPTLFRYVATSPNPDWSNVPRPVFDSETLDENTNWVEESSPTTVKSKYFIIRYGRPTGFGTIDFRLKANEVRNAVY